MQVIGNIGSSPEVRKSAAGREYDTFTFAENHMGQNHTGPEIPPTWYEVSAFVKPEERQLLVKGAFLRMTGRLVPKVWFAKGEVTKENARINLSILVHKVEPMARKPREGDEDGSSTGQANQAPARQAPAAPRPAASTASGQRPQDTRVSSGFDEMDEDIPF